MINRIKKYVSKWFIFGNMKRPIIPFVINLLYWKDGNKNNVGDLLSKIIFKYVVGGGIRPSFPTKRLVGIGSVLSFVGGGKTTVWGTGLMNEYCASVLKHPYKHVVLDIRAVRGPLTRKSLIDVGFRCPAIYGDPAILLPIYYFPDVYKENGKIVIIPHHSKLDKYKKKYNNVLDTYTDDWKSFVNEIISAEKVISSSLHGIIIAESYGVPCLWLNDIPDSPFKYEDYYLSTGRNIFPLVNNVEEGINRNGEININLKKMQKELLNSFPFDIF